jgi:LacI family transcriptional regulator
MFVLKFFANVCGTVCEIDCSGKVFCIFLTLQRLHNYMTNTTLKKISQVLGISISTVSRALKNHPDISERTKQKVVELASTLDYEPNVNAIHLRTKNTMLFGVIVPNISNHFYDSFIAAIEENGRENGYNVMILQSGDNPEIELNNLRLCRQNRVSGLFACITPDTKDINGYKKLIELEIPVIFFDKVPLHDNVNKVCVADEEAAALAANTLVAKNKKNILALFGNEQLSITQKRLAAFTATINSGTNKVKVQTAFANNTEQAQTITLKAFKAKQKPDAIFCMSDEVLAGSMKALQQLGLTVKADVGVIAISTGYIPKLFYPEITYAETSGYKLGSLAYKRMMACINGSTFIQELTVDTVLVEGGSL